MNYYSFDPTTGVLLGQGEAQPDPLELALLQAEAGEDAEPQHWLIPGWSTTVAPPAVPAGKQAVFADGAWSLQAAPQASEPSEPAAPDPWATYQGHAHEALNASDRTILRCVEKGVAVPADWAAYREALRAIIGAASGDATQPLPERPAYPAGT